MAEEVRAPILIVDDNAANLLAMEAVLDTLGEPIIRAASGAQALQLVEHTEFAVILLDVRMPGIDGFETAMKMREQDRVRNTPIIFLTAADEGDAQLLRGYAEGAADFVLKPFRPDILRSKVRVFVTLFHQARKLRDTIVELEQARDNIHLLNNDLERRVEDRTRTLERNESRLQFLLDTSELLSQSLNYEVTLDRVVTLAVPGFADMCSAYKHEADGSIVRIAAAYPDSAKADQIREMEALYPELTEANTAVLRVIATGNPVVFETISTETIHESSDDPEVIKRLLALGLTSYMCLPLKTRDKIFGALSFVVMENRLHYGKSEQELGQEIARRAAFAIDNALLYRAAQDEISERRRAEARLREADQRLRGIMDNAAVAIQIKDINDRYILVNREWEILTGIQAADAIGKTPYEVYPADIADKLIDIDKVVRRTGVSRNFEEVGSFHGARRVFISTKFPLFDDEGKPYAVGGISIDITERRRIEEALQTSETRFRALFEQSPLSIQIISPDGTTLRANKAWEELWESTPEQLEGWNIFNDPILEAHGVIPQIRRAFAGESLELPPIYFDPAEIGRTGRGRWVEAFFYPIKNEGGMVKEVALMLLDVSARKDAEDELIRLNEALIIARDAALEASHAKSSFLANMSHELRTPLNAIIGYAEMLEEELRENQLSRIADDLGKIQKSGIHLLNVISDILDLSKIEAGRLDIVVEEFNINSVLREAVSLVLPVIQRHQNTIEIQCDDSLGTMTSDRTRLRQIMFNLLSNAAKFTENGKITIICERSQTGSKDTVCITVQDTGIGMSPDQVEKLFQKFHQVDASSTRRHGGTGLGLAISKLLCNILGGDISAQSSLTEGSSFIITLPVSIEKTLADVGRLQGVN